MSQGSYRPSLMDVVEHRKRDKANRAMSNNPGFQTQRGDVLKALRQSERPLSTADLQLLTHHQQEGVRRRINRLLERGEVEKRTDGPDGRVVYYQPKGMEFQWDNNEC